ncbi:MAG: hypothetical protein EBT13_18445 [Rhodobacteraceae bacterium]|nr:hypothetical protein [Paracoccaceae bacterium]
MGYDAWCFDCEGYGRSDKTRPVNANVACGADDLAAYPDTLPIIYIQNNLPYANRLENGWSGQAPQGMVALTVAEVSAAFDGRQV